MMKISKIIDKVDYELEAQGRPCDADCREVSYSDTTTAGTGSNEVITGCSAINLCGCTDVMHEEWTPNFNPFW